MNPILLKPESDRRSQVIVHGTISTTHEAREYFEHRGVLFDAVRTSYERLAGTYDVIVIEGAGSAAEMNLRDRDLVNWPVVELADADVILVADIDRGGVFAQVIGTLDLLAPEERRRVLGVVVNKFRGDATLFADGVAFLEARTGIPVLGVLPFLREVDLDQEDGLDVASHRRTPFADGTVNVAVTLLPRMSNFTDFNALVAERDVALRYAAAPTDLANADVVIVPGSKNTIADLAHLRNAGFVAALLSHVEQGGELVGVCGGYQMLGHEISDPHGMEAGGRTDGLGMLDVVTELGSRKTTRQVEAVFLHGDGAEDATVSGYEIHLGTTLRGAVAPCFRMTRQADRESTEPAEDGAFRGDRLVWGTYIHGIFDRPGFRRLWLNRVRQRKGLPALPLSVSETATARLGAALDRWADHVQQHVDLTRVLTALGLTSLAPTTPS